MAPSDHWQDIGPTYCVLRFHKPSRDASGAARAASSKLRPSLRSRVLGAHVLDIVICEIAVLKRHCNPVHAGSGAFLRASGWYRYASGSCRHEGATTKRCHIDLPGLLELVGGQAEMCNNIADRAPQRYPLSELCKLFSILQGQLASFTLFALVWDMPLLRPDLAEGLKRRMTIALRNGRGRLPGDGHVRVGSSGKHIESSPLTARAADMDQQLNGIIGLMCRSKVAR